MPRRSTRSRPYERRRRTRRARKQHQHGGDAGQNALINWFQAAQALHAAPPAATIAQRDPRLQLPVGGGPTLSNYYPPYLGDIVTNIAIGLGDGERIQSFPQFARAIEYVEKNDKDFFEFMTELEKDLRTLYMSQVQGITGTPVAFYLSNPTPSVTPFLWIAYSHLPDGDLEPRAPVLGDLEVLKKTPTANPAAPSPQVQ
jgi:hypothetical protein